MKLSLSKRARLSNDFFFVHNYFPSIKKRQFPCSFEQVVVGINPFPDNKILDWLYMYLLLGYIDNHVNTQFMFNSFPNDKFLDSSKLKEFADDNFKFDENDRKFSKLVKNTVRKGEIARYKQFLLFA